MTSVKLLSLYSGGQDSVLFFLLICIEQQKQFCSLMVINHEGQLNTNLLVHHTLAFGGGFQQSVFLTFLNSPNNGKIELNEQLFRLSRYQLTVRLKNFYQLIFFLSCQTTSDIFETIFSELITKKETSMSFDHFGKKMLINKFYHQEVVSTALVLFLKKNQLKSKKKNFASFSTNWQTKKKQQTPLYRPIKHLSRTAITIIVKEYRLPVFIDLTNFSISILRNRIRHHLIIYFQEFFDRERNSTSGHLSPQIKNLRFQNQNCDMFGTDFFFYSFENEISVDRLDFFLFQNTLKTKLSEIRIVRLFHLSTNLDLNFYLLKKHQKPVFFRTKNYISFLKKFL